MTLTVGVVLVGCGGHPAGRERPAPVGAERVVLPGYVDPADAAFWNEVVSSAPSVHDVILDPLNGPGPLPGGGYLHLVNRLRAVGMRVLGYVRTGQGRRTVSAVEADMARWNAWYGVRNIFFGRASDRVHDEGTYRTYAAAIHRGGGVAVLDPGDVPAQGYFTFADAVVTFQDAATTYLSAPPVPAWLSAEPRRKVWNVVLATPGDELADVLARAYARHAGEVYVTDDAAANPYDGLPSYWSAELAGAQSLRPATVTGSPAG